jgi:hypothetical protein
MTLSDIRAAVRERADDPTFDNIKLDRWTNWVLDDIYTRYNFPFMEASTTFNTVDGTQEYALTGIASDIDKIRLLTDTTNDVVLDYIDPIELEQADPANDDESKPYKWTVYNDTLKLWPTPDAAYVIKVTYKKVPAHLTANTESPLIPERYQEIVVLGVFQKVNEWNDDYDYAGVVERQYEQKIMKMISDYRKESGQYRPVAWERPEIG